MTGSDFERMLTQSLNRYFDSEGIKGIAVRQKQIKYSEQGFDILVDSRDPLYYLAIECKSVDGRKTKALYFSQHFNHCGGVCQVERETEYLNRSGRFGLLAVEVRKGPGKARRAYLVPWSHVSAQFVYCRKGILGDVITSYPEVPYHQGKYWFSDSLFGEIGSLCPWTRRYPQLRIGDMDGRSFKDQSGMSALRAYLRGVDR